MPDGNMKRLDQEIAQGILFTDMYQLPMAQVYYRLGFYEKLVYDLRSIGRMRARREADVERLDPGVRRFMYPHIYHVSLIQRLWDLKQAQIEAERAD
jgi:hypothetical protein